jgi:tetratricopeptide (TPR) repeat protein
MPGGPKELDEAFEHIRRKNPQRSLEICERYIRDHPDDPNGYYSRFQAFSDLGENDKALADINKVLELDPNHGGYSSRAIFFHNIGNYERAIEDSTFARGLDNEAWEGSLDARFRADSYARLGLIEEALADCEYFSEELLIPPGVMGLPGGTKQEFIGEIKRRAAAAQKAKK